MIYVGEAGNSSLGMKVCFEFEAGERHGSFTHFCLHSGVVHVATFGTTLGTTLGVALLLVVCALQEKVAHIPFLLLELLVGSFHAEARRCEHREFEIIVIPVSSTLHSPLLAVCALQEEETVHHFTPRHTFSKVSTRRIVDEFESHLADAICLSIFLSTYLSMYLSIYLSIYINTYMYHDTYIRTCIILLTICIYIYIYMYIYI